MNYIATIKNKLSEACGGKAYIAYFKATKERCAYFEVAADRDYSFYDDGAYERIEDIADEYNLSWDDDSGSYITLYFPR